jgi:hypothetical protein
MTVPIAAKELRMYVLREVLERAQTDGTAVAHFNVCDLVLRYSGPLWSQSSRLPGRGSSCSAGEPADEGNSHSR